MPNYVIVGAGLGGLYTASRLINKGIDPKDITIIDPRAGNYTRPGHLNRNAFMLVSLLSGIKTNNHSTAQHIKELERIMYGELQSKNVHFVTEQFIKLQPKTDNQAKAVITKMDNGSQGVYPADFVFDCTGRDAHVAQAVNTYQETLSMEPVFKSTLLVDTNPITDHLFAQVLIPQYHFLNSFIASPHPIPSKTNQKNIEAREQLQDLGWSYEAFPSFYSYPQREKDKICLYMETPLNLPKEQRQAWIKLLLSIYSNGQVMDYKELNPSRKYGEKPRIMGFKSEPHLLNKVIFQSDDLPTVIIGFDALKGFDYRLAHGATSGINCCEMMLQLITINEGNIEHIKSDAIEKELFNYIKGSYKGGIIECLKSRQNAIEKGYAYFSKTYAAAAEKLPQSQSAQKQHYRVTAGELAYQGAIAQFSVLESRNKSALASLKTLNKCLSLLIRARQYLPSSETTALHDINAKLHSIINHLRLEMAALNIDPIFAGTRVKTLCEKIKSNMEQLEGSFASTLVRNKANELIEQIAKHQPLGSSTDFSSIFSFLVLSSSFNDSDASSSLLRAPSFFGSRSNPQNSLNLSNSLDNASDSDSDDEKELKRGFGL